MSFFHEHHWEIESTNYTHPLQEFNAKGMTLEYAREVTQGVTHVYMRCTGCGNLEEKRVTGHFTPALSSKDTNKGEV